MEVDNGGDDPGGSWTLVDKGPQKKRKLSTSSGHKQNDKKTDKNENPNTVIYVAGDTNLGIISPIKLSKMISAAFGKVTRVVRMKTGGLRITCLSTEKAELALNVTTMGVIPVKVSLPREQTFKYQGVIGPIEIDVLAEEISDELNHDQSFVSVRRMTKYVNGERLATKTFILTYSGELPTECFLGAFRYKITPTYNPTRCYKCQRYGHGADNCHSKLRCAKCAGEHKYEDCVSNETQHCKQCKKTHSLAYKGCQTYYIAKEVQVYKTANKLSYAEAARAVKATHKTIVNTATPATQTITPLPPAEPRAPVIEAKPKMCSIETQTIDTIDETPLSKQYTFHSLLNFIIEALASDTPVHTRNNKLHKLTELAAKHFDRTATPPTMTKTPEPSISTPTKTSVAGKIKNKTKNK